MEKEIRRFGLIKIRSKKDRAAEFQALTDDQDATMSAIVKQLVDVAQLRYGVRQKAAHQIQRNLGNGQLKLSRKLEE